MVLTASVPLAAWPTMSNPESSSIWTSILRTWAVSSTTKTRTDMHGSYTVPAARPAAKGYESNVRRRSSTDTRRAEGARGASTGAASTGASATTGGSATGGGGGGGGVLVLVVGGGGGGFTTPLG